MKRLTLVLVAAFALALGHTAIASAGGNLRPTLTEAIQPFAPRVTAVYCDSIDGYGYTYPDTGVIYLDSYLCSPLEELRFNIVDHPGRQGAGLLTLTHEAIHNIAFEFSEARTECVAFQQVDNVLRLWHTPFWVRNLVLPAAYRDHRNFIRSAPLYRNTAKCRPNGAWDLTPGDGRWP